MSNEPDKSRRIGPFLLEKELGVGGMGIVYRATYEKTGNKCAVKVLAPDLTTNEDVNQRFIRETEILKRLQHPNIIRYFGAGSTRAQRYYAMELIDGGSLDRIMKEAGRLNWEAVIDYSLQIAKALEHAHNAGIVHRDLKPGNLLLTKDGVLKLSDFGIARDTQATALTQAGKTVGTMAYMAPEQITGKHPVNRRTDLYALGCVMFEMLTGRVPFESETHAEMLFKHLDEPAPLVREFNQAVPLGLSRMIDELLAKEPEKRPFDALAVQVQLEEIRKKAKAQEARLKTAAAAGADLTMIAGEAAALAKKKKKKKQEAVGPVPFYEKTWFLAGILVLLIGGISFAVIHQRSEGTLYARARKHMELKDENQWVYAENTLKTMLLRYPEGEHAAQGQEWLDQIGMLRAERGIETAARFGRDPSTEAERLYVEAQQYEKFGDRLTALEKYEAMPSVIASSEENRPFLNLARRKAGQIKQSIGDENDRTVFIQKQLDMADELHADGQRLQAREKWQAIIRLYGNNAEFEGYTSQARERLTETAQAKSG